MSNCTTCPNVVGDSYERDCAFPDCVGGWEQAYIEAADEITRLREAQRWISVDERLPPTLELGHYRRYLITNGKYVIQCSWLNEEWHEQHDGCSQRYPTHWMPLPEPPEVKE